MRWVIPPRLRYRAWDHVDVAALQDRLDSRPVPPCKTRSCAGSGLDAKAGERAEENQRSWVSALLGQQPAARSPLAVPRGFAATGAILASPHLRVEGKGGVSVVCGSGGYPLVVPIQAAGLADLNDLADLRRLYSPVLRAVHL